MKSRRFIEETVENLLEKHFLNVNSDVKELNYSKILEGIVSESSQAIKYVTLVEEEFDLVLDDDDIDLNFFLSVDNTTNVILKYL